MQKRTTEAVFTNKIQEMKERISSENRRNNHTDQKKVKSKKCPDMKHQENLGHMKRPK